MANFLPASHTEGQTIVVDLTSLPPKPPRSKLEPHRELIRELRRKGRTYRDIARILGDRVGLSVTFSTIHSFIKVRAKHRKQVQYELPPLIAPETIPSNTAERIAALKTRPSVKTEKPAPFEFQENEPLTLISGGETK
jgi:hypothetical protein